MTEIKVLDAAKILGRSPSTVARMIRAGDLQAKKRGKTWYLNKEYVERVASNILSSEEASLANLKSGRLPKTTPKQQTAQAQPIAARKPQTAKERPEPYFLQWLDAIQRHDAPAMREAWAQWQEVTA
jgi:hypothetical protein